MRIALLVAASILALPLTAWLVIRAYDSLPEITAVSCSVYGDPILGHKGLIMDWLVRPTLIGLAASVSALNVASLAMSSRVDRRFSYLLPLASLYIVAVVGWIDLTVILSSRSLVPVYPLLIYIWILIAVTVPVIGLATYYISLRMGMRRDGS